MLRRGCDFRESKKQSPCRVASNAGLPISTHTCHDTELTHWSHACDPHTGELMPKAKFQFLQKPTCSTCRKAKAYLERLGADLALRSLDNQPLSEDELDKLIGDRNYKQF